MGEWKTVKLAEVLRYRKGNILINNDKEYSLCRVQLHRRGVVLREKKMGSQIKTKKQQVCKAGDLIVAEMDAKFGGYGFIPDHLEGAIVSSHYYLYELDKSKITQEYFGILIKTDFIQNQIEAKGSTNYSSIRAWEFLDYEIPLQSIALQNIIAAKYLKHARFKEDLGIELHAQLKYLSQLRQQILQEAIEGKLTVEWRKKNPELISGENHASKLLEKIKAEKRTLTESAKYTKKDKPLAPITDDEKPFDLPEGWVWCRFGELCKGIFTGPFGSMLHKSDYVQNGIPTVNPTHIIDGQIVADGRMCVSVRTKDRLKRYSLTLGDLVIARRGDLSKCAVVRHEQDGWLCGTGSFFVRCLAVNRNYICLAYISQKAQAYLLQDSIGQTMDNLNQKLLRKLPIGLPTLSEQQAIVDRVDKLMSMINELEKQVSERKEQSEMLMQSVLREAFTKG